jgi:hypothetical protein
MAAAKEALHLGDFLVRETGQRRPLSGNTCLVADFDQFFTIDF